MDAQRPPTIYRTHIKQLLDESLGERRDWQAIAVDLDQQIADLSSARAMEIEARDLAILEAQESELRAADLAARLEALRSALRVQGKVPELFEQQGDPVLVARSCAEAIEMGRKLTNIVIHPDAPREVERMDQSPDVELWGQRIWVHLQALDAYADDKGAGFETWCRVSGSPKVLSPKFISMSEGKTVREGSADSRTFSINRSVDKSGRVIMLAHTKPIQGGGMQIPRIYFYDDSKGVTGKVHIGFIGPHDLVPNAATN
jgi:hypothetical protein